MNFALILFVLVILTGVAWVADKLVFLPKRRRAFFIWMNFSDLKRIGSFH